MADSISKKDFEGWHAAKKSINQKGSYTFYCEREIWWCSLGVNVGTEQDGTGKNFDRPVLIVRGFNSSQFLGVSLTGKNRSGSKWHVYVGDIGDEGEGSVILSQIRTIDARRLIRKMGTLNEKKFNEVVEALKLTVFP